MNYSLLLNFSTHTTGGKGGIVVHCIQVWSFSHATLALTNCEDIWFWQAINLSLFLPYVIYSSEYRGEIQENKIRKFKLMSEHNWTSVNHGWAESYPMQLSEKLSTIFATLQFLHLVSHYDDTKPNVWRQCGAANANPSLINLFNWLKHRHKLEY